MIVLNSQDTYTFDQLQEFVGRIEDVSLIRILHDLINEKVLKQFVRVKSPYNGNMIQDYPSFVEIPERISDYHNNNDEFTVKLDDLVILYSPIRNND